MTDQTTPTVPAVPTEPTAPSEPAVPTEPTTPSEPAVPTEPTTPTAPVVPAVAKAPKAPNAPTEPVVPAAAKAPAVAKASAAPPNSNALLAEAGKKSGLLWVDIPGDRPWPAWHAWLDGTAYVVTGPGEQQLPALPADLAVTFRSKDTGGRLVTMPARAAVLTPEDERWEPATTALKASRLNAPAGDIVARWAAEATVYALTPHGEAIEGPDNYSEESGATQPPVTTATTANWRPWHLAGRPKWRRGTRR